MFRLTDQGRQFIASDFKDYMIENNIKHITPSPQNPECNGFVKGLSKTIGGVLRINVEKNLEVVKREIQTRLDSAWQGSIGKTQEQKSNEIQVENKRPIR